MNDFCFILLYHFRISVTFNNITEKHKEKLEDYLKKDNDN
jgi:hypothetical protein